MADNTPQGGSDTIATDDIGGVKYQRFKPSWGVDGAAVDASATDPFPTSLNASIFRFSTNNSTTAQLASNATFTGVIETALDQPSMSLLLTTDQPVTLTVFQYIDIAGTFAAQPIVFYIPANQGFSYSLPLNANYVRVTAKNTGTATTTTLNLNTAYGSLPSADGQGRVPVSQADCYPLLVTSLTTTGVSATIDTSGYAAIVVQLTGVWQGALLFEGSNSGLTSEWDGLMAHSRDNPALQDIITSGGLYTIRPAGRYLRINVTNITGTIGVNAVGRSGTGIDASDYLSLAMIDEQATPLNVRVRGNQGLPMAQDSVSGVQLAQVSNRSYSGTVATTGAGTILGPFPCDDMASFSVTAQAAGATNVQVQCLTASGWVAQFVSYFNGQGSGAGQTLAFGTSSNPSFGNGSVVGSQIRVVFTSGSVSNIMLRLSSAPIAPIVGFYPVSTVTTSGTTTNTPATPTSLTVNSAATTNATSVKGSAGTLYGVSVSNTGAAAAFVKFYNKATAPTVGTDVPVITLSIPASGTVSPYLGDLGYRFATGIALAITNLAADSDTTAVAANQVKVIGSYI
jgi:hypothetical protein